jgi:3-phenylpropionate/cinnamic acid dioxygenase small subunit
MLPATDMLPFDAAPHQRAHEFLVREAELLDNRRYDEWLELLTEDIVYRMPVTVTTSPGENGGAGGGMHHFDEDLYSLRRRVARFATEHAWTEDPPSRTRRLVTNVRAYAGERDAEWLVRSYLLLFRSRGDVRASDFVVGERTDVLRQLDGRLRLASREFLVDESVIRTQNLAVFV